MCAECGYGVDEADANCAFCVEPDLFDLVLFDWVVVDGEGWEGGWRGGAVNELKVDQSETVLGRNRSRKILDRLMEAARRLWTDTV